MMIQNKESKTEELEADPDYHPWSLSIWTLDHTGDPPKSSKFLLRPSLPSFLSTLKHFLLLLLPPTVAWSPPEPCSSTATVLLLESNDWGTLHQWASLMRVWKLFVISRIHLVLVLHQTPFLTQPSAFTRISDGAQKHWMCLLVVSDVYQTAL